jgi:hypothetical protein
MQVITCLSTCIGAAELGSESLGIVAHCAGRLVGQRGLTRQSAWRAELLAEVHSDHPTRTVCAAAGRIYADVRFRPVKDMKKDAIGVSRTPYARVARVVQTTIPTSANDVRSDAVVGASQIRSSCESRSGIFQCASMSCV